MNENIIQNKNASMIKFDITKWFHFEIRISFNRKEMEEWFSIVKMSELKKKSTTYQRNHSNNWISTNN